VTCDVRRNACAVFDDVAGFQWTKSGAIILSDHASSPHTMLWANWCSFDPWVSPLYMFVCRFSSSNSSLPHHKHLASSPLQMFQI
jgi:hypothetical protein